MESSSTAAAMPFALSVIIPCYNAEKTIRRCLASVAAQRGLAEDDRVEVIVIDDASADRSAAVAEACGGQLPLSLRLLRHEHNSGVSCSRNDGIDCAAGQYIMFLDADDEIEPDCCSRMLSEARRRQADITAFNIRYYWEDGRVRDVFPRLDCSVSGEGYLAELKGAPYFDISCAKLFRRDFIEREKLRFTAGMAMGEDTLFANRAAIRAGRIAICGEYFGYRYYCVGTSAMNSLPVEKRLENLQLLLESLAAEVAPSQRRLLLRKSAEYLWTVAKLRGKERRECLAALTSTGLWRGILYPVLTGCGKFKHRTVVRLLQHHCWWAISLW